MPVKFEWQADQEHEWTEEQDVTPGGGGLAWAVSLRKHWRIWLPLLGLFVIIGVVAYVLLNQQAEGTSNLISNDVLASHQLVAQTVADRDVDVFATTLFPYSRDWSTTQVQLLNQRLFWDRAPLGLWAAPHLTQAEPEVTLAPDFQSAVVETGMPYVIERSDMVTETVVLVATAVYALNEGQWQLAPPDEATFWGQTRTEAGEYLNLSFPSRDAEIGQRLAADLDALLADFCRLPSANCPPDFQLRLGLSTDPPRLLALARDFRSVFPRRGSDNTFTLTLPAPTLVGLPVDEAGYQAVRRGYGGWVTAVLYSEFNRSQQPDYQTISQTLARLDLRPPPLVRERPWQIQTPSPIPLPEQDVLMLCLPNNDTPQVWHYDLAQGTWANETAKFAAQSPGVLLQQYRWPGLTPMPGDNGALFQFGQFGGSDDSTLLFLWQAGQITKIPTSLLSQYWLPYSYLFPAAPSDRYLFFYELGEETTGKTTFYWLDLFNCPGPNCQMQSGDALPYWSPDESKAILYRFTNDGLPTLALADADGQQTAVIGPGWLPAWFDNDAFAYVRPDSSYDPESTGGGELKTELVIAEVGATAVIPESSQVLLHSNALLAALPEAGSSTFLSLMSVVFDPNRPETWYLLAMTTVDGSIDQSYLFAFDRRSGAITMLTTLDFGAGYPLELQGDGRYLATTTSANNAPAYFVYDLERERPLTYDLPGSVYPQIDWSADGQWLALPDDGVLRLIAPGSRYERPLFHGIDSCGTAVWVNR